MSATTSVSPSLSASISAAISEAASSAAAGLVSGDKTNVTYKIVGVCLAIGSGIFIGSSFVVKKKGLLNATMKSGNLAGEGHAYLKNWIWWTGMTMMVIGEVLNFVAYAFTEAILVTPLGALSVVISAILSHFVLKETLTLFGWVGCALCIIGATILALNAPEQQSVTEIEAFKHLFLAPGFLVWASLSILASAFLVTYGRRWARKTMLVYIAICSLIGGISVSCTQGLGASIVTSITGNNQVKNWFFWFLFVFVVVTLLTEINYLNKALELFNTSMVVPVYFTTFTTCTLISSILYQGLKASAITLITMVLGFVVICLGITLLQMSKVDPTKFRNLDRRTTILLQAAREPVETNTEKEEVTHFEDPGMDALRGGFGAVGSIMRARSVSRRMSLSQAGLSGGKRWYEMGPEANMSTHGLENLRRYQLSDNPMPTDASDKISQHVKSPSSPNGPTLNGSLSVPPKSKSHLKFGEDDIVHQYDPNRQHANTSTTTKHGALHSPLLSPSGSKGIMFPVVVESPEEDMEDKSSYMASTEHVHGQTRYSVAPDQGGLRGGGAYNDPYARNAPPSPRSGAPPSPRSAAPPTLAPPVSDSGHSTTAGHGHGHGELSPSAGQPSGLAALLNLRAPPTLNLHLPNLGPSPKSSRVDLRGGDHRGMADYPRRQPGEESTEQEERARLVGDAGASGASRPSEDLYRDPMSSPEGSPVTNRHSRPY